MLNSKNTPIDRVCIVGLGKLGAPIAAAMAHRGLEVVAVDTDPAKVEALNHGQAPVTEPGLSELIVEATRHLSATTDLATAVRGCDATIVIVPTPSEPDGRFSLRHVLPVCEQVGGALRDTDSHHLVVIASTVMPGDTNGPIRAALERCSGRPVGAGLGLCYSPEFVALGSVIHDYLHPELVLIGQSDPAAGDAFEQITARVAVTRPRVARMTPVNAELAKLAVNTFVTTKITFANMLAEVCQHLPGADVDAVTQAIGHDSRIGRKYLRGGLGYGGPCFPRDNRALAALARRVETRAALAEAVDRINHTATDRVARLIRSQIGGGQAVAVLGLAYKLDTDVIECSPGLLLATQLAAAEVPVVAYDPVAGENAAGSLPASVRIASCLQEAIDAVDVLVVATPWPQFVSLDPVRLARPGADRRLVVDCWRCLDADRIEPVADYLAIGIGPPARDVNGTAHPRVGRLAGQPAASIPLPPRIGVSSPLGGASGPRRSQKKASTGTS